MTGCDQDDCVGLLEKEFDQNQSTNKKRKVLEAMNNAISLITRPVR
ncbi:hypothetical protein EYZ11_012246 [Aspergillus tanneri]|uniref:Uncharacterized protein n=1 Tax=Aspergillus tanneri TaxID=1220188 RepID=A0A4S3J0Z9_9EURO|nr:hypothetical protein EYZ11_012246 [Aspergillus tanneri]